MVSVYALGCGSGSGGGAAAAAGTNLQSGGAQAQAGSGAQSGGAQAQAGSAAQSGGAQALGGSAAPSGGAGGEAGSAGQAGTTPSSGGSGAQTTGGSGAPSGGAGGVQPIAGNVAATGTCPSAVPQDGATCDGLVACTYGDSPRIECRTRADCRTAAAGSAFAWGVYVPNCELDERCPAQVQTTCDLGLTQVVNCIYSDGTSCTGCQPCADGCPPGSECPPCDGNPEGTPVWACEAPPAMRPGCPPHIPNAGTACSEAQEATVCYSTGCPCNGGESLTVVCAGGTWQWQREMCPATGCPVCASPDTPIATPTGDRPIADLHEGDLVLSMDGGVITAVPIARTVRRPVHDHAVVHVVLANGGVFEISAPHPTGDGRLLGSLAPGDRIGDAVVASVSMVPYPHAFTYDILPASDTGSYFSGGAWLGSTLR